MSHLDKSVGKTPQPKRQAAQTSTGYEPSYDAKAATVQPLEQPGSDSEDEIPLIKQEDALAAAVGLFSQQQANVRFGTLSGGLFGDSSIPSTLPAMVKLAGPTATQYRDWKIKALSYFQTNGLTEVVTMSPSQSLARAIMMDNGHRSTAQLKGVWCRLHSKSFGVIRTAIESTVGTSLFDDIEDEHQRFSFNILDETLTGKTLDTQFISGNAYYLWEKIRIRLDRFTPHDLSRLIDRYMNLKYTPRQDPAVFRREFDNSVRELRQAGLTIPDKLHLAVWYRALPPEFDSLRQALGANPDLTWNNIYDAIITQYSANYSIKKTTRKQEDEKALSAVEEAKKERLRRLKDKNKTKEEDAITDKKKRQKECTYCGKTGHTVDKCYALENDKKNADSFKQNGKQSDSEEDDEHAAPFVDDELLASWYQPSSDSDELVAKAGDLPLSQLPFIFSLIPPRPLM